MAYPYPLAPAICRGCGQEFTPTDPRQTDCKKGCGRSKRERQTNDWLLANRPHLPTEPCLNCGKPVVQYRKRRRDGDLRDCSRKCSHERQPRISARIRSAQKTTVRATWPPFDTRGARCKLPRGCIDCGSGLRLGRCSDHHNQLFNLRQQLRTRLSWLLPRTCAQCKKTFKMWGSRAQLCPQCRIENFRAQRKWGNIKRRHRLSRGSASISPARLYERDNRICALCHRVTDHPRVWQNWVDHKRWLPNAPTVDHIIPLAKGGEHIWENVQLAHWSCNSAKGDLIVTGASLLCLETRAGYPAPSAAQACAG